MIKLYATMLLKQISFLSPMHTCISLPAKMATNFQNVCLSPCFSLSFFFFLHLSFVFFCLHAALPWPKLWVFLQPVHHLAACHSLAQWAYKRLSPPANVNTTTSPPATVVPILCHLTSFVSVIAWCWFTTKLTFFVLLCNIDFMSSN